MFISFFFFFNDTATTEIYTLSLHDALPIWIQTIHAFAQSLLAAFPAEAGLTPGFRPLEEREQKLLARSTLADLLVDRKSTRLNSSHANISYAVFCLKKKKNTTPLPHTAHYF